MSSFLFFIARFRVESVVVLLGIFLTVGACSTTQRISGELTTPRIQLTARDSATAVRLDSVRIRARFPEDTLLSASSGRLTITPGRPALYVLDIMSYGYHPRRHVPVLVSPTDSVVEANISLIPKQLSLDCTGVRPLYRSDLRASYRRDSSQVRMLLGDVFAYNDTVNVQPVVVNSLPVPVFMPDNLGALGHYEIQLFNGDGEPIPFRYADMPPDQGHRIYTRGDILAIAPQQTTRLSPSTLITDSVATGTTIFARMQYAFSRDTPLRATSVSDFPSVQLSSLQTPRYDTVRVDGRIDVPARLVLQRDTTTFRVVGIDTTVTRDEYVLYSTRRDSNIVASAEAALSLLFIPDSVKRARKDSLSPPAPSPAPTATIVSRTDRDALDKYLDSDRLAGVFQKGIPSPNISLDSLLSLSETVRTAFLTSPSLDQVRVRRGLNTSPDTLTDHPIVLSAPQSDSLFQAFGSSAQDTSEDSSRTDTLRADSVDRPAPNSFLPTRPRHPLAPTTDSIPVDSLRLTVRPSADTVVTGTAVAEELSRPPRTTYRYVPESLTTTDGPLLVLGPAFFRLPASAPLDFASPSPLSSLTPARVGEREERAFRRLAQQIIRVPEGTYRDRYLSAWRKAQQRRLRGHYCEIFPYSLLTDWLSTSMQ